MPYYKDLQNKVHVLDSAEFEHLLPPGCVQSTEAEAAAIQAPTTDQVKVAKWESIKEERARRKASGVKVGAKWFHSDDCSRIQQIGLVMMGANIPADVRWKTMDGTTVTMTQTLAGQIFATVAASDIAIFAAAETHKAAMEAAADPAAYDFSGGWPKVFGE